MEEINVNNWAEFEHQIHLLKTKNPRQNEQDKYLFRGQANHGWNLETTLERRGQILSLSEYHRLIVEIKPDIEKFTQTKLDVSLEDIKPPLDRDPRNLTVLLFHLGSPEFSETYKYMVYLRHHGFPSPLLDWTSCFETAAYFAFREPVRSDKISIYAYLEFAGTSYAKFRKGDHPQIHKFGPYGTNETRHRNQKSQYTICFISTDTEWCYVSHENNFARSDSDQDLLWKFNIPSCERNKVLKLLDAHGINALSLFESEESLMETLTLRKIDKI
ncbi:MAG: FRG domain-containing protein [Syntrophaceae bacterium]|nr:FRG domain-containing protein [Syntrophaceae bacterium]